VASNCGQQLWLARDWWAELAGGRLPVAILPPLYLSRRQRFGGAAKIWRQLRRAYKVIQVIVKHSFILSERTMNALHWPRALFGRGKYELNCGRAKIADEVAVYPIQVAATSSSRPLRWTDKRTDKQTDRQTDWRREEGLSGGSGVRPPRTRMG